jgi:hypothetical protein
MPRPTISAAIRDVLNSLGLDTPTAEVFRLLRDAHGIRLDPQDDKVRVAMQRQYLRDIARGSTMVRPDGRISGP